MRKKTVKQNGLGVIKTIYGNDNPLVKNVTDFGTIRGWGDKNKATTHDGLIVERQEYIFVEGYGMVHAVPYELHFIWEDKSKKRGRWVFMCFPADTQIDVNGKQVPIQHIEVGDEVLTHQNRYRRVLTKFSQSYSGDMYTIKTSGNREVFCTAEHPFMVLRGDDFRWITAQELSREDMLVEAIPSQSAVDFWEIHYSNGNGNFSFLMPLDEDAYRLFGYYLAEGYLTKSSGVRTKYRVDFAFNSAETDYIQEVSDLMYKYFNVRGSVVKTSKNGVRIAFTTQIGYEVFYNLFGKLAYNKSIPLGILLNADAKLKNLIQTYWRGDGSSTKDGFTFDSTSYSLIHQIQKSLYRFGIVSGVTTRQAISAKPSYIGERKITRKHDLFTLTIYGASANKFARLLEEESKFEDTPLGANRSRVLGGVVLHKILDIQSTPVNNLVVYNFEVEEDNSYHAENFIVHNCTCGSPAGIISYKAMSGMMSPKLGEYILCCLAHTSTKMNTGIGKHADGSTE